MSVIEVSVFGGEVPKIAAHLLPDKNASHAEDCILEEGMLTPWRADESVDTILNANIIKLSSNQEDKLASILKYNTFWYGFNEPIIAEKAPIIGDENDRIVISGSGSPRITDKTLATHSGLDSYILGIPKPDTAATVVVSGGGTGTAESTAWTYTYVREWSDGKVDEGPPAPPSALHDRLTGQTATLSGIKVVADYVDYNISKIRIYRTRVGTQTTEFVYVDEIAVTDATDKTYVDTKNDDDLGEVLPSGSWSSPPAELKGIINIGRGLMAGFEGNSVYLSDEFQPHGWPSANKYDVEYPIVGLGVVDNFVIVMTEGNPSILYVQDSSAVQQTAVSEVFPCLSAESIVSTRYGVFYASSVGLVRMTKDGPDVFTEGLFSEEDWYNINPSSIIASYFDSKIFFFWKGEEIKDSSGKIIKIDTGRGGYILELSDSSVGLTQTSIEPLCLFSDPVDDRFYYASQGRADEYPVYNWGSSYLADKQYRWRSKEYISSQGRVNFSAGRVIADYDNAEMNDKRNEVLASILANLLINGRRSSINSHPINTFPINGSILSRFSYDFNALLYFYADGKLVFTKEIKNDRVFRMPTNFSGKRFFVELRGNLPIRQVQVATCPAEVV